jgi:hypothetical protein
MKREKKNHILLANVVEMYVKYTLILNLLAFEA